MYNKSEQYLLKNEQWWLLERTGSVVSNLGLLSPAPPPEAVALLLTQVLSNLQFCKNVPHQACFQNNIHWLVPTEGEKRNIVGTQNDHAADQPRDCEKLSQGDGKDEVDVDRSGDIW